ncbi:fibronectin type III domain-containing protein [Chitinophaga filiformis]|uniref:fibronectin type III domain-containing protein n=1 Tax=Chitinophaga filiformis TaxID=104663 RepID=UPI001F300D4B|nr:fibronectin type III domain-containing protein [Chitinophaga filiformis]MCF6404143.1 fibronectin type III domain-containing protein [Chitinophaga filiformis]
MLRRTKYIWELLVMLLLCCGRTYAQTSYPVMATMQINPPYSLYLSDYTAPDVQRMQVHLLLKDLTVSDYKCRLKIKIEGFGVTLQSKPGFYTAPIILQGGEMITLSGPELATYLNPQNLLIQGLDNSALTKEGAKLPEGIYKFTVEVVDYTRNIVVSNQGNAVVSTFLSYPPIINLPMANTKVDAMEPQNLVFQWVPRHTASFNAAFNVAYKFKLVELIPANRDPNDALRTTRPVYETITAQTLLVYGPGEPMLTPGKSYAVQVQAIEAEGKDMFVNDGFSEAVRFTYGEKCGVPADVIAAVSGKNELKLTWRTGVSQQAFTVRYREAGDNPSQWYEETSYLPQYTITGLKQGKKYEYQVNAQCIWGYGDYSAIQSFTMPNETMDKGDFVCGKVVGEGEISNRKGLEQLKEGDVIIAGDFKVAVKKAEGSNGLFSGNGKIKVPFLNFITLPVVFKNISVNTDKKMYAGVIELQREDIKTVTDNMNESLDGYLEKISDIVRTIDTAGLKAVDAAGMLAELEKMKGWDELDNATLEKLGEIQTKLQELQQLQESENMTPEEKATAAKKVAEQLKNLADQAKAVVKAAVEELKKLVNMFRKGLSALRQDYTPEKVAVLKKDFEDKYKVAKEFIDKNNALLGVKVPESLDKSVMKVLDVTDSVIVKLPEEITAYKLAQKALDEVTVLKILDENKSQAEEEKVVNALNIKDQPFKTFIINALKTAKEDDLIPDVKTSILNWVHDVLEKMQ